MSRLFQSLVVCGASLGLVHCGGRSTKYERAPAEGKGGNDGTGRAGAGSGSGQGGKPVIEIPVDVGPPATPGWAGAPSIVVDPAEVVIGADQQWSCLASGLGCSQTSLELEGTLQPFALYRMCEVDPTLPRSQSDCAAGEAFTCAYGLWDNTSVLFDCQCTPLGSDGSCACPPMNTRCGSSRPLDSCEDGFAACGCPAYTCIL